MRTTFLINEAVDEYWKCSLCGKSIDAGYALESESDEEYEVLETKFGTDLGNWFVGECCFGGYCYRPDAFVEVLRGIILGQRKPQIRGTTTGQL